MPEDVLAFASIHEARDFAVGIPLKNAAGARLARYEEHIGSLCTVGCRRATGPLGTQPATCAADGRRDRVGERVRTVVVAELSTGQCHFRRILQYRGRLRADELPYAPRLEPGIAGAEAAAQDLAVVI